MTPEQVAAMQAGLKRHAEGDPATRERLRRAYASALGDYALMAAQGTIPVGSAAFLSAMMSGLPPEGALLAYFRHLVERGVAEWERAMDEAEQEVCYEISYLLDAGAPSEKVAEVARSVSWPLAPWHLDWIVAREKAWWVRLNAALDEAVPHAA